MKNIWVICLVATIFFSCTRRIVDFTIISTRNIDLSKAASFQKGKTRTEGIDRVSIIIFIPTGVANMKEAIDRAIQRIPGCVALLDGVVYYKMWWIPYIYGEQSYAVEGTPLIDPSLSLNSNNVEIQGYSSITIDKKGATLVKNISKQDYLAYKVKIVKSGTSKKFKNSLEL